MNPDSCVLAVAKCNLATLAPSLFYSIRESGSSITVEWGGTSMEGANDLITLFTDRPLNTAKKFLKEELAHGALSSKVLQQRADEAGITKKTLARARKESGVMSRQTKDGWECHLPQADPRRADGQMVCGS